MPSLAFAKPYLFFSLKNCNDDSFVPPQNIEVYINGIYQTNLTDSLKGKTFAILKNLDTGNYKFYYHNEFYIKFEKSIRISEDEAYQIELCADYLGEMDKSFYGLIDSISSSEPLFIKVYTGGCFSTSESELVIFKKGRKYFAQYSTKIKNDTKIIKQTYISKQIKRKAILLIRNLEFELNRIDYYNKKSSIKIVSTGTRIYELRVGNKFKEITVSLSSWGGINKLADKIF